MPEEADTAGDQAFAIADAALRSGDIREAIDRYQTALRLAPDRAEGWFNLAWAQRADRRFVDAVASYGQAIEHGIDRSEEALLNRASILSDYLSKPEEAIEDLQQALRLNPTFVAAWLNLATIHEDLGSADQAREAYRHALRIDPVNARAAARIGVIDTYDNRAAGAIADLRKALDHTQSLDGRAEILFALGGALDRLEQYQDAFQAVEAANTLAEAVAPLRYDPARVEGLIDRLTAMPWEDRGTYEGTGVEPVPIFICGMFRSGSTLIERILARHSLVTAGGEIEFVPSLVSQLDNYPDDVPHLPASGIATLRQQYLAELPSGGFVTDKRCDNFLHIGLIKLLFPAAKIVHTRRMALDNILSIYSLGFGDGVEYSTSLVNIAHFYIQYRRITAYWKRLFPNDICDVDYDRLVEHPDQAIQELLRSLHLPFEDITGREMVRDGAIRTGSVWQARGSIHTRSSGRSAHYADQLAGVRHMLADKEL